MYKENKCSHKIHVFSFSKMALQFKLLTQRLCYRPAMKSLLYATFAFLHSTKPWQNHAAPMCDFRLHADIMEAKEALTGVICR